MSQLLGVLEEHPLPFVAMGVLFAMGAAFGVAGISMARRRCATSRKLGWVAVGIATVCDAVGLLTMFVAESAEPPLSALVRGMTLADVEAVQAHAELEGHYCLVAGIMMSIIPFAVGVIAIAQAKAHAARR